MSGNITSKQEAFANEFVRIGNASEAYRVCYDVGEKTLDKTVWEAACRLLADGKVNARVKELQQLVQNITLVTVNSITEKLEKAYELAEDEKQSNGMIAAANSQAKLHGLLVEKTENKNDDTVTVKVVSFKKEPDDS